MPEGYGRESAAGRFSGWRPLPGVVILLLSSLTPSRSPLGNDPNGYRLEPGACLIVLILLLRPGEAPEGRARGGQDTTTQAQRGSES